MVPSRHIFTALLALLALCATTVSGVMGLPVIDDDLATQFDDTEVAKIKSPMSLAISPDGTKMFVTQKEGYLHLVENFQPNDDGVVKSRTRTVLNLFAIMCSNGERALGGIALHPKFGTDNNWIYLYYTYNKFDDCDESFNINTGPVNRFSRWEYDESSGMVDPDSEKVFFDTPRMPAKLHNSGDIAFGKDGHVYVTVGDGGGRTLRNAAGEVYPQALDRLLGKVLRLTEDGDIPSDNPYANEDNAVTCSETGLAPKFNMICKEIYSRGHRNPIRFAMNPNTPDGVTEYYINEVGRAVWEEISKGGTGYAGANYGYPKRTGKCIEDSETKCEPPKESEGFTDPIHWYHHDPEHGGCVTAGAFVPNDAGWPAEIFKDAYIYADYAIGGFYVMTPGGEGCEYPDCKVPVSPYESNMKVLSTHEAVIFMKFGPAGIDKSTGQPKQALYYVSRDGGMRGVHKIEFTGTSNRGPKAQIVADPVFGFKPLLVNFDGTSSVDLDGDDLTYEWDVDGDGVVDSTSSTTSFEFNEAGTHYATLTVMDGKGGKSTTEVRIEVENTPPVPEIVSPAPGTTFAVGEEFVLMGIATDGEDGALDDSALTWEVRQHHNTHYHPFVDPETPGNNLVIRAPEPEDFDASLTSYLEILLTATDSQGLSTTSSLNIYPRNVEVTIDSVPSGLEVVAYGDVHVTPKKVITWENHIFEVEAYDQIVDGNTYSFDSWSDGGQQTHEFEALPVSEDSSVIREDGTAKNVIVAKFSKDGVPVDDGETIESPAEEVEETIEEEVEEAIEDEGELAAIHQDEEEEEADDEEGILLPVPEGEPSSTDTTSTAELVDFAVIVNLAGSDSAVRRRQLEEDDVVAYLNDNLKSFTANALKKEMKNIVNGSGFPYAKPNGIRLTRKSKIVNEGKSYEAVFGGFVTFKRKKDDQHLPTTVAVHGMQLQALDEISHQVFYDLKSNVPGARVATVITSTDVPEQKDGDAKISSSSEESNTKGSMDTNFIIIISCAIVGGLCLVALAALLIVKGRRRPESKGKASTRGHMEDDESFDFPQKTEESYLITRKEDARPKKDTVDVNNTMDTDNESPPTTPTKEAPDMAPVSDDSESPAPSDDDESTADSALAVAPDRTRPAEQDLEMESPTEPEAASDDEGSTHFGSK